MLKRTGIILSALLVMSLVLAACDSLTGNGDDDTEEDGVPPQQEETPADGETPEDEDAEDGTPTAEEDATPSPEGTEEEAAEGTPDGEAAQVDGEAIYMRECAACHGEEGEGNEMDGSRILPHNENPIVTADDPSTVISVVLTGRGGMPRFDGILSDEEIAAVVSYIRTAWDNDASEIDAGQIDEVRQDVIPDEGDGEGDETQGAGDQEDDEDAEGTPSDDETPTGESEDGATPTEESDDEN